VPRRAAPLGIEARPAGAEEVWSLRARHAAMTSPGSTRTRGVAGAARVACAIKSWPEVKRTPSAATIITTPTPIIADSERSDEDTTKAINNKLASQAPNPTSTRTYHGGVSASAASAVITRSGQ
jgi:hypothetical protein